MKNTRICPKCHSADIVRVRDNPRRYSSGNSIYLSPLTLARRIPVIRYVCCECGYVENWVEAQAEREYIRNRFR